MSRRRSRFATAPSAQPQPSEPAPPPAALAAPAAPAAPVPPPPLGQPAAFRLAAPRRGRGATKRRRPPLAAANGGDGTVGGGDGEEHNDDVGDGGAAGDGRDETKRVAAAKRRRPARPSLDGGDVVRVSATAAASPAAVDAPVPAGALDPLDAYMRDINAQASSVVAGAPRVSGGAHAAEVLDDGDDGPDYAGGGAGDLGSDAAGYLDRNKRKRPVYERVDHSRVAYAAFQKDLYLEVPELARMTADDVRAARRALGSVRIRGKRCPKPIRSFGQCGLSSAVLEVIRRAGYDAPTPIQAQAIPCIMSGRDVIGVAKTGSGKTLAFLLPVLRHAALQERPGAGEGPIAVLVAPTRELAIQIYGEAKRFARATDLRCVCAYGGSGVKDQITDLKRGADIVVCTPGRMIDLLAMNSGRITNLRRVTIVVLDEADRMFDMGFEPQLTRLVENVRPDRQTVMFSATFPPQVERLARQILTEPVEVMIGGNSVAANTIDQHIEVRPEDSKFRRLLQLLGVWYEKGSTLVFVDRQDNADRIFRELSQAGYLCVSLHGGMDQADRDSGLADFKNGDVRVLVATSVAARGLDVKQLTLVVNFDVPNHYEDYVHRVGRTGRAGRAGTAHTFITPDQDMFAGDMVKALEMTARSTVSREGLSKEEAREAGDEAARDAVPADLRQLARAFLDKQEERRKAGVVVRTSNSGYGGRGFTFDDDEDDPKVALRKSQAKRFIKEAGNGDGDGSDSGDDGDRDGDAEIKVVQRSKAANTVSAAAGDASAGRPFAAGPTDVAAMIAAAEEKARREAARDKLDTAATAARVELAKANVLVAARAQAARAQPAPEVAPFSSVSGAGGAALSTAAAAAAALSARISGGNPDGGGAESAAAGPASGSATGKAVDEANGDFEAELEINDYPQHARWRVTHANALDDVTENTGCVATTRGNFYPAGRNPPAGERKLHLLIEGQDERSVKAAYKEIKRKLEEAAAARPDDRGASYSKYSVV
jgi:ATP-dependent RNA helicase DDX46/PRP5